MRNIEQDEERNLLDHRAGFYRNGLPPGHLKLKTRRICLVTSEFHGLFKNGGIGTANTGLALELATAGWEVSVLYIDCDDNGPRTGLDRFEDVASQYLRSNIRLEYIPQYLDIREQFLDIRSVSYSIYRFFCEREYSAIYFNECGGHGFYTVMAGRAGALPNNPAICVVTHGSIDWAHELNSSQFDHIQLVIASYMEKKCVQYADAVISPSEYLLNWMNARGWLLPDSLFVEQNVVNVDNGSLPIGPQSKEERTTQLISEIVFFGRQEIRKGVRLFCDALDHLAPFVGDIPLQITFLGKFGNVAGVNSGAYIVMRSRRWNMKTRFLSNLGQTDALKYLIMPGRLAVIPSLAENSPCVVAECLALNIPFIATDSGGTAELVAETDWDRCLVIPDSNALAKRLLECIKDGQRPARMAKSQNQTRSRWREFHCATEQELIPTTERDQIAEGFGPKGINPESAIVITDNHEADDPLVSICIVHHNRPLFLKLALESALEQTYRHVEIIVVDDGSNLPEAADFLRSLETVDYPLPVRVIRQENRYIGAARNAGARHALGEYFIFVDDDNLLMPSAVFDCVRAARCFQADIVTGVPLSFYHSGKPAPGLDGDIRYLPLGGCTELGYVENCFGDATALVSRTAFEIIGGFHEEYGQAVEDWELFAKASLAGLRLEVLPKPIFWYRVLRTGMLMESDPVANARRIARVYCEYPIKHISRVVELLSNKQRARHHHLLDTMSDGDDIHNTLAKLSELDPESKPAKRLLAGFMIAQQRMQDALDFALCNDFELVPDVAIVVRNRLSSSAHEEIDSFELTVRGRIDITPLVLKRAVPLHGVEDILVVDRDGAFLEFRVGPDAVAILASGTVPSGAEVISANFFATGDTEALMSCLVVCDPKSQIDMSGNDFLPSTGVHFSPWQAIVAGAKTECRVSILQTRRDVSTGPRHLLIIVRGKLERSGSCTLTWSSFMAELTEDSGTRRSLVNPAYYARRLPQSIIAARGELITRWANRDPSFDCFARGYPTALHPIHNAIAAIRVPRIVPKGAIGARTTVSVAHDDAHPIQFGLWLNNTRRQIKIVRFLETDFNHNLYCLECTRLCDRQPAAEYRRLLPRPAARYFHFVRGLTTSRRCCRKFNMAAVMV